MKILISLLFFTLVACGQVEVGVVSNSSPATPTLSPKVESMISQWTDPPSNVVSAAKRVFDSLEARNDLKEFKGMWFFNLSDTTTNPYVNLMGTTPDGVPDHGAGCCGNTIISYVGYNGAFDKSIDFNFNPTTQGVLQNDAAYITFVTQPSSSSDNTNVIFGIDNGSDDVILEDERSDLEMSGNIHAGGQFGSGDSLLVNRLYAVQRDGAASWDIMMGGTSIMSRTESSGGVPNLDMHFGGIWNGTNVAQEWPGVATMFAIASSNVDLQGFENDLITFNAVVKYSPEAQKVLIQLGMDDPDVDEWRKDIVATVVDRLQNADQLKLIYHLNRFGMVTESRALQNWMNDSIGVKVGTPTFVQSLGFSIIDTASAINTKYVPQRSPEDHTYITKIRANNNTLTDNYIWWSGNNTYLKYDTDNQNWVGKAHSTGLLGQIFLIDTTDLVAIRTKYPDNLKLYKNDSVARDISKTHDALPTGPVYIGGIWNGSAIEQGSLQTAEWFIAMRGEPKLDSIKNIMFWADSAWQANAPVGPGQPEEDTTPPTTPTIAFTVATDNSLSFDITVASTDANGIVTYEVEKDQTLDFSINGASNNFTVPSLTANTSYDTRIRAVDPSGNKSSYSNEITQSTTNTGTLTITVDFETDPANPPLQITGPNGPYTITDPTVGGNKVSEHEMEIFDGTTLNTNYTSRREYNYQQGIAGSPPKYIPWFTEAGFRFRIYFPTDHIGDDQGKGYWSNFHQLHHDPNANQTGGPPMLLQTQDADGNNVHDLRLNTRYNQTFECNCNIVEPDVVVRNVFAENTWYYIVLNVDMDWQSAGSGYYKVYVSSSGWPGASDLVASYVGPTGFRNSNSVYAQLGMYWANTRVAAKLADLWSAGTTKQHWYIDDWTYQDAIFATP